MILFKNNFQPSIKYLEVSVNQFKTPKSLNKKTLIIFILNSLLLSINLCAQDASILFSVYMSYQIEIDNFDPSEDFIDIAGDFNDWGSTLTQLSDNNQDSIYTITLSGFNVGQSIQFKFRMNGLWDGTEEFPGGGSNRVHTVISESDSLYFWYNDEVTPIGSPQAHFSVSINETQTESVVSYSSVSSGNIDFIHWIFEGGTPESSTEQHPNVFYNNPGTFDVQLIVGNETQSDTLIEVDYISVSERDKSQIDWWNNSVFYEVFVRSFYDSDGDGIGDLNGLTQKLDYLNDGDPNTHDDLGINGIWLMPIHPSPSYHGYDVIDYKAINPDYGTMDDFASFLNEAHNRGIKVIIDFVMNHSSSQHQWFIDSKNNTNNKRDYYRWSATDPGYEGPWGQPVWHYHSSGYYYGLFWSGMPDINYGEPQVKDSMFQVANYWLNDIGIDGFRLDAIGGIFEEGEIMLDLPETVQFWKDFNAYTKSVAPESFSVGEAWTNTSKVVRYVEDDGLDFCFEFDLASRILNAVNYGNASSLQDQMTLIYSTYPHLQWGTFLTNHDMNRVMDFFEGDDEKYKLAASIYLTLPGVPYIYYGEEIGMLGSKPDEDIRRPMQWSNTYQGGFTSGTPWNNLNSNYPDYNVESEQENPASIFNRYKKMIQIRNLKPSLQTGNYLEAYSEKDEIFSFIRVLQNDTTIVVINTSNHSLQNVSINLTAAGLSNGSYTWWELMNNNLVTLSIDQSGNLLVPTIDSYGVNIFSFDEVSSISSVGPRQSNLLSVYPNPCENYISVHTAQNISDHINLTIYNLMGNAIKSFHELDYEQARRLSVEGLTTGVYIIVIETDDTRQGIKLIKQ